LFSCIICRKYDVQSIYGTLEEEEFILKFGNSAPVSRPKMAAVVSGKFCCVAGT
jgi:hypothetical protein